MNVATSSRFHISSVVSQCKRDFIGGVAELFGSTFRALSPTNSPRLSWVNVQIALDPFSAQIKVSFPICARILTVERAKFVVTLSLEK